MFVTGVTRLANLKYEMLIFVKDLCQIFSFWQILNYATGRDRGSVAQFAAGQLDEDVFKVGGAMHIAQSFDVGQSGQ